jgi:hypothetical protein
MAILIKPLSDCALAKAAFRALLLRGYSHLFDDD